MIPGFTFSFSKYTEYIIGEFVVTKKKPRKVQVCFFLPLQFNINNEDNFGWSFIKGLELEEMISVYGNLIH